jgi:DNA recombination protein RmuC
MIPALIALQALTLLAVLALLLRKPAAPDPRLAQLAESLPSQLTRLETRNEALDHHLRNTLAETRAEHKADAKDLRHEVIANITGLGSTLTTALDKFAHESTTANSLSADKLRNDVEQKMRSLAQSFYDFNTETTQRHIALQESLNTKLLELMNSNAAHQDKLRQSIETRLDKLNTDNSARLEQMRVTVEEKLDKTLQSRVTEAFGQVTTHLTAVQKGLGEMKELATGVSDLKKVFSNVKSRGGVGEFLVGQQLADMFSPEQYLHNARIKPNTTEAVEYALKFPNGDGASLLLAIDSKFPREDWERLEDAYEHGTPEEIATLGKAFERAIRTQGKSIGEKYIDPPTTMPHAIMVLPTESLYAEVVRRPGLQSEIQQNCRVTIAGPSTFMAILTSFQMGFQTLAIQKKGDEVWRVLARAKGEFEKFGGLMDKVEKQVGTVQSTLHDISRKTKTINTALRGVSSLETTPTNLLAFEEPNLIQLAAAEEE